MRANNDIHNLDTLEKEIYRQQLILIESQKQLKNDMAHIREHFFVLAANTIKQEMNKGERRSAFFDICFRNEQVCKIVSGIKHRIPNHAVVAVDGLIEKLLKKYSKM